MKSLVLSEGIRFILVAQELTHGILYSLQLRINFEEFGGMT